MTVSLEKTDSTVHLWAKPADVAGALRAVLPHVSKDGFLPVLAAVHVVREGNELVFEATDRFTVGRSTVQLTDGTTDGPVDFLIPAADAKRIMDFAKREKYAVTINVTADRFTITNLDGEVSVRRLDGDFLNLGKLIENARSGVESAEVGPASVSFSVAQLARFDAKYIARDRHEAKDSTRFAFQGDGHKTVLVTFGEHFVGLIMPRRQVS